MRLDTIVFVASLVLLAVAPASAEEVTKEVAKGIALYDDLEYEKAAEVLGEALSDPKLPAVSREAGLKYLGLSQVALGRENAARDSFRRLLELDRRFALDDSYSPEARKLLEEVRLDLPSEVKISQRDVIAGRANSPVTVTLRVTDPSGVVSGVVLHYRQGDDGAFSTVQATKIEGSDYTATIPGAMVAEGTIGYYATARAISGTVVATLGSQSDVQSLDVLAAKSTGGGSVLGSPWLWAGVGAVVVGGSLTAFFLLRDTERNGFVNITTTVREEN